MRKSNGIIIAIFAAASVAFLWLWHALRFDLVDNPLDLVIALVWWAVIAGVCIAIHLVEKRRQERIRTMFLAPGLIYNSEAGVMRIAPDAPMAGELQRVLGNLTYGFEVAELPSNSRVRFQRIVRTSKFADQGDVWEGEVVEVATPDRSQPLHSRRELAALLEPGRS